MTTRSTLAERYALAWLLAAVALGTYVWVGAVAQDRPQLDLMTDVDRAIAFMPWTVWIYLGLFIGIFHAGVFIVDSREHYMRMWLSLVLAGVVAYLFFYIVPATYPRPDVSGDGASMAFLRLVHRIDPPNNTFPSLHVAYMTLVALGIWRFDHRVGWLIIGLATLPSLTILTTKQHYLADLGGGVVLAVLCHWLCFLGSRRSEAQHDPHPGAALPPLE